jgi:hypothetical protein
MSRCYHCRAELLPGSGFCANCGRPAPPAPATVSPDTPGEGARFLAKNAGIVAGIFVLIGFVLPWATWMRNTERGFEFACEMRMSFSPALTAGK